jgi:nicotinamidase-related amidase
MMEVRTVKDIALMVVDVQQMLIDSHPYREAELLHEIRVLIDHARANGVEVVYVRHNEDDPKGLLLGSPAWQVHAAIAPESGEKIFDKRYSSAFKDTGLDEYLRGKGIKTLVIAGMQTEYCIDATIKSAFERGYELYMPEGGSTTYNNKLATADRLVSYYEKDIWNHRFADVISLDEALSKLK